MKRCLKCQVNVSTTRKTCPLCGNFLENSSNEEVLTSYPPYEPVVRKRNIFLRILLFICLVGSSISVVVNLLNYNGQLWSLDVIVGAIYIWILFKSTILSKRPIAGKLVIQMIFISLVLGVIDYVSNKTLINSWAISYAIPALSIATTISIIIVLLIKRMRYSDYVLYFIETIFLGFVPLVFYLFKLTNILWPSLSAAGLSLVTILGMIIFADRQTKDELKKRFHI